MSNGIPLEEQHDESPPKVKRPTRLETSRKKKRYQFDKKERQKYSVNLKYLGNICSLLQHKELIDKAGQTGLISPEVASKFAEQIRQSMAKTVSVSYRIVRKIIPGHKKFSSYWLPAGITETDIGTILDHHEEKTKELLTIPEGETTAKINKIAAEIGTLMKTLETKESELASLHEQRCEALEAGNQELANQLKTQINAKNTEIATIEADLTTKKSEKAKLDDELKKIANEYITLIKSATGRK